VIWVDVQGLGDRLMFSELASIFNIHETACDVIINTPQRVKALSYQNHQLYVTRCLRPLTQVCY
jgi:Mg2+ and Co2+ transporter CorA